MRFSVLIQALSLLPIIELRPGSVHFHTVGEYGEGDFQPYREAGQVCKSAVLRIDVGPAPQRDDGPIRVRRLLQVMPLERSKVRFSLFSKYLSNLPLLALLDFLIEIDKLPAELPCQGAAYGRLT